ncbi:MAG: hypothetical protein KDD45_03425 [Bdellovibrionales bacterium]|nr:hypothetical protein [Bdellovibrionales bacterium]
MNIRKRIFFMAIFLTATVQTLAGTMISTATTLGGYNTKYYCQELSYRPSANRNWREPILKELTEQKYPLLFQSDLSKGAAVDLIKYCPNYPQLSEYNKKIILLRLLDGMVFFESSCSPTAKAKGPNGTAYGVLQLHYGREQDYARNCRRYDSKDPVKSMRCSLNMIQQQIANYQRVFSSASYWDVLRPNGQARKAYTIASHLWYYPLCQINKTP